LRECEEKQERQNAIQELYFIFVICLLYLYDYLIFEIYLFFSAGLWHSSYFDGSILILLYFATLFVLRKYYFFQNITKIFF